MKSLKLSITLSLILVLFSCKNSTEGNTDSTDTANPDVSITEESNQTNASTSESSNSSETSANDINTESENQSDYVKIVNDCGDKIDFAVDPSGVQNNSLSGGSSVEISMKPGDKVRLLNGGVIYTHTVGSKGPVYICK